MRPGRPRPGRGGHDEAGGLGSGNAEQPQDAAAWYGDAAVPQLADAAGFCAALLYADWASGRLVSETVWQDLRALAASRSATPPRNPVGTRGARSALAKWANCARVRLFWSGAGVIPGGCAGRAD